MIRGISHFRVLLWQVGQQFDKAQAAPANEIEINEVPFETALAHRHPLHESDVTKRCQAYPPECDGRRNQRIGISKETDFHPAKRAQESSRRFLLDGYLANANEFPDERLGREWFPAEEVEIYGHSVSQLQCRRRTSCEIKGNHRGQPG